MLKTIKELDIENKSIFIRCDFNVPIDEFGNISDDRRIRSALSTIRYCIDRDCKVVLASHFGRPKAGKFDEKFSLYPVFKRLDTLLKIKKNLYFDDSREGAVVTKKAKELFDKMEAGDILLLENLRFDRRETEDDVGFAKSLLSLERFISMMHLAPVIENTLQFTQWL